MSLIELNGLSRCDSGVYAKDGNTAFDYSDGRQAEIFIRAALTDAEDLSSVSEELEAKTNDWPSEYHFSSKRANLLRALNLHGLERVLELGCGCGSITRYLGEQELSVDAVEGSMTRAELAALRCRELPNVNIICSNFNDLEIPRDYYDAVLFVGVLEYAGRYFPRAGDEERAVIELLKTARGALRKGGVVLVAIENRTGMKYILGAHEDHYAKRYVGIHDYMEKTGIKTYTMLEWRQMIENSGFRAVECLYPFPDYKVPTVILSQRYVDADPYAYCSLEGINSRDYVMQFNIGEHEPMFWESANATKTLGAFANSFLMLMGDSPASIASICDFDFAHLPGFSRKRQYCLITKKPAGRDLVVRTPLPADAKTRIGDNSGLRHLAADEPYWQGVLLSVEWSRSLLSYPWADRFQKYLKEYFDYLRNRELSIDLLPTNIVLDKQGVYRVFDEEWKVQWDLSPEYLLFRALLFFSARHRATIREFTRLHGILTTRDLITFGFNAVGIDVRPLIDGFIRQEQRFQNMVNVESGGDMTLHLVDSPIHGEQWNYPVYARVYWRSLGQGYTEERSITLTADPGRRDEVELFFELPRDASHMTHFRFDPCDQRRMDDVGLMRLTNLRLGVRNTVSGEETPVMTLNNPAEIVEHGVMSGMIYAADAERGVFAAQGNNPELEFHVDRSDDLSPDESYFLKVNIAHLRSAEYQLVRDRFLVKEEILQGRIRHLNYVCEEKQRLAEEIELMKASLLWRLGEAAKSIFKRSGA